MSTQQSMNVDKSRKRKLCEEDDNESDDTDVKAPPQRKTKESNDDSQQKTCSIESHDTQDPVQEKISIPPQPEEQEQQQQQQQQRQQERPSAKSKTVLVSTDLGRTPIALDCSKESATTTKSTIRPLPRSSRLQRDKDFIENVKVVDRTVEEGKKIMDNTSISIPTTDQVKTNSTRRNVDNLIDFKNSRVIWGVVFQLFLFLVFQQCMIDSVLSSYKSLLSDIMCPSGVKVKKDLNHLEQEAKIQMEKEIRLLDYNIDRLQQSREIFLQVLLPRHDELTLQYKKMKSSQVDTLRWLDSIEQTIHTIEKAISHNEKLLLSPIIIATVKDILGERASEHYLLDLHHVVLWNMDTAVAHCNQTLPLTAGRSFDAQRQLLRELQDEATLLTMDEQMKMAVTQWLLENSTDRFTRPIALPGYSDVSQDTIREQIHDQMEVVAADFTGKVDFAAIPNGGAVITTGPYATSPSLVETLPVGNRILQYLHLRFYGHGPEAAITPTYPLQQSKALGQCWSFTAATETKGNDSISGYAVLSIKLAQPIYATQVSIEHPPKEINDHANAAIRSFRIVGFTSVDATGKAWDMGHFEYNLKQGSFLQTFDLERYEMGGVEIPAVHSLSVLIDSNWGLMYSCLYRFRVHGEAATKRKEL